MSNNKGPDGWMTTSELYERYDINSRLCYDWFDLLRDKQLSRRTTENVGGTLLFSPLAQQFLLSRKGKQGNPQMTKDAVLEWWLARWTG